ncbi:hypothetical protein [Aeromonas hydrophila]|uniref:hypothetical protein n=1 Tax=Aeromonas hydrophila TaxID=644 RepID=UPI003D2288CB
MIKPITNHIHPVTVEELETIHAHVNGTFAPSSIAKEREAYASGQEASANLFELVAAAMPERNTKVLCNIDLSAPIEQLQAEIAALRVWAYGDDAEGIRALTLGDKYTFSFPYSVEAQRHLDEHPELYDTLEKAFSTMDSNGWRCWVSDKNGDRVMESAAEKEWATSNGANFFVKFIAGNPEIFNEIRTSPSNLATLDDAMSELSTIESHGWRGWIEDKDGNRVKETTTETLWAGRSAD